MTAIQDRAFFQRVVDDSIEVGYIHRPAHWRGHAIHSREMRPIGGNCFICCIPCCGRIDDELAVLIGTVFFIFSSIIAFAYSLRSMQSACQANRDLSHARYKIQEQEHQVSSQTYYQQQPIPSYHGPSAPPYEYVQSPEHLYPQPVFNPSFMHQHPPQPVHQNLYHDAEILLEGRRSERTWIAISQGAMCVGAALLTAALLATLIVEGEIVFLECGFAGIGVLTAGVLLYGGTKCFHLNYAQQEAAQRISDALYL